MEIIQASYRNLDSFSSLPFVTTVCGPSLTPFFTLRTRLTGYRPRYESLRKTARQRGASGQQWDPPVHDAGYEPSFYLLVGRGAKRSPQPLGTVSLLIRSLTQTDHDGADPAAGRWYFMEHQADKELALLGLRFESVWSILFTRNPVTDNEYQCRVGCLKGRGQSVRDWPGAWSPGDFIRWLSLLAGGTNVLSEIVGGFHPSASCGLGGYTSSSTRKHLKVTRDI